MRTLAVVLVLVAGAAAESKRYPVEPVDRDAEKDQRSGLWDNATNPQTKPYARLVGEAKAALGERTDEHRQTAVLKLTEAIALTPADPTAYLLRGEAYMELREWSKCADDLGAAVERRDPDEDVRAHTETRRRLGLCLARANKLAQAERVLAEAAASGTSTGEMLMRLGEVRIAMGKLDEAIAALTAATDATDTYSLARWLLMAAYDRARRPAEAIATGRAARTADSTMSSLFNPTLPLLGTGEREYLLGLAYEYARLEQESAEPERALLFFRRFQRIAADSPWKKRADEHLRDLKQSTLPETIRRVQGAAAYDLEATRGIVRAQMPALRSCLAKAPNVVFTVAVTRVGPKSTAPPPAPPQRHPYGGRYPYRPYPRPIAPPPEGVSVEAWNESDPTPRADKDAALRCIEPIVTRMPFAKVKEANGYVTFSFLLISS